MHGPAARVASGASCRPPFYAILLISAAALAYEVLLIRLFSIIQWHHFAYMVISLALLGYGASGSFVTLLRARLLADFPKAFLLNAILFGLSAAVCFLLAQRLPFNTLELFWDPAQMGYLALAYLLLFIPFFFAANCICLSFARFGETIPRIYGFDLVGAGLGALGIVALLYLLAPPDALRAVAAVGCTAAAISALELQSRSRWSGAVPSLLLALIVWLLPGQWFALQSSEYKALNQTLQIGGTRILEQHSSPLGLVTLLESPNIPLRLAEGLSLNNRVEPPPQLGLFTDGDTPTPITQYRGERASLEYLDYQTSALPFHLQQPRRILILGMGGGSSILQAEYHAVPEIHAVELNPWLPQLLQDSYADFAGWRWLQRRAVLHTGEARSFVDTDQRRYELIQMSLLDAASATSGGVHGLSENYLYTVEAIGAYLQRLQPGGLLSITRWMKLPPRDGLRLFATAVAALRLNGFDNPGNHLLLIRSWNTTTLVIKNGAVETAEIGALLAFCKARAFDIPYYPGMPGDHQANRYNILPEPYFHQGAIALLGEHAADFIDRYKFDITPTSDDRPYFFNFFKWRTLPEISSRYRRGGFSLLELGYPVLVLTLMQAVAASLLLVLLPLRFLKSERSGSDKKAHWRILGYFFVIGLAYLFIEIAFIQKLSLFLAHPVHAVAVVISGFLVFSGIGSLTAGRIPPERGRRYLKLLLLLICAVAAGYLWLLPMLLASLGNPALPLKVAAALLLIAPLAFCMGMPFPLGLSAVAHSHPMLVPWAWGINGCASLISAVLATLLAIHWGFNSVILIALALYLSTIWFYPTARTHTS